MLEYFLFVAVLLILMLISELTRRKGFSKLSIKRYAESKGITEGERFKITIKIENNKWLPLSFLHLSEKIPLELQCYGEDNLLSSKELNYHNTRYSVKWYERVKRSYYINAPKRGTYLLREIQASIGDLFAIYTVDSEITDYLELLVYPRFIDLKSLKLNSTSINGNSIIKRWLYKDSLYIKGIREYNIEDRMKDIHWKSSLKMNKLMVKDYDYTSEMEVVIILNIQCGVPYWSSIDAKAIEAGASLSVSLARQCKNEGIPVGMWTNSQITYYGNGYKKEIEPSLKSLDSIMELCARVDYAPRTSFSEFLIEKSKAFNKSSTYIIITAFLSHEDVSTLNKLTKAGFLIKIIDVSSKTSIPTISGIEKAIYKH